MTIPLQVTFRNLDPSLKVVKWVDDEVDKLEELYYDIKSCRVAVEVPLPNHRKRGQWHVRVHLKLPSKELVIVSLPTVNRKSRTPKTVSRGKDSMPHLHRDLRLAIRSAFEAAGHNMQDFARIPRADAKPLLRAIKFTN